jgi:hypothetical protein
MQPAILPPSIASLRITTTTTAPKKSSTAIETLNNNHGRSPDPSSLSVQASPSFHIHRNRFIMAHFTGIDHRPHLVRTTTPVRIGLNPTTLPLLLAKSERESRRKKGVNTISFAPNKASSSFLQLLR